MIAGEVAAEKVPLLSKDTDQTWPAWRLTLAIATMSIYIMSIIPVAVNAALVPALEDDRDLGWGKVHSGTMLSVPIVFEAMGLMCLGWLSDVFGGPKMLIICLATLFAVLVNICWQQGPVPILGLMTMIAFVRGGVFPAATKLMSTYLGASQWEVGICMIGLASRAGDLMTSEFIGILVYYFGWRGAVAALAGISFLMLFIYQLVVWKVEDMRVAYGALESSTTGMERKETSIAPTRRQDLKVFYSQVDTWLLLILSLALQPLWVWGSYVGTFAHSMYGLSASRSALTQGAFASGQLLSLIVTLFYAILRGGKARRPIYVGGCALVLFATCVPIILLTNEVTSTLYAMLSVTLGFSMGMVDYVPVALYCMHFGRKTGDYALYSSSMYSIAYVAGAGTAAVYGYLRRQSEVLAFTVVNTVASCCTIICFICLALHILRNWDGDLFNHSKAAASDPESSEEVDNL